VVNLQDKGGWTLIELLAVLAVMISLFAIGVPKMTHMIKLNRGAAAMNWLVSSLHYARFSAIDKHKMVTLCPSSDGLQCSGNWHDGTILFTDRNADRVMNQTDMLLQKFTYPYPGTTIKFRSFRNRQYLQFTKDGWTNFQNGNWVYCSEDKDPQYARQIVINIQGRVRNLHDLDKDGRIEDRYGKTLRC